MVESNTITITVLPLPAASISISASATSITAGQSVTFTGTVLNADGSPVSGQEVTLVDSTTGSTFTTTTNSSGTYSFVITFDTAGSYTLYSET